MKVRIDWLLVEQKLASDLREAKGLIMAGLVVVNEQRVDKPGTMICGESKIRVKKRQFGRFVSRGGEKLYGAVMDLNISDRFRDAVVLDIGASTGGFTDCSLYLGAKKVIALDVGVAQLDWKLRSDSRVICLEKTDIRNFDAKSYQDINFVVGDISFNSLSRLAFFIKRAADREGVLWLLLIKPQFELPRCLVPRGGVVKDEALIELAISKVSDSLQELGITKKGISRSRVKGNKGNQECFILAEIAI